MREKLLPLALMLFCSGVVMGEEHPKAELFGGYSCQRFSSYNFQGWNASLMVNINRWFALGADVSGYYNSDAAPSVSLDMNLHSLVFGPQFSRRTGKTRLFSHVLVGATRASAEAEPVPQTDITRVALMFGGGFEVNLSKRLAARVVQVDYHSAWGDKGRGEGVRFSAGLTIKLK